MVFRAEYPRSWQLRATGFLSLAQIKQCDLIKHTFYISAEHLLNVSLPPVFL